MSSTDISRIDIVDLSPFIGNGLSENLGSPETGNNEINCQDENKDKENFSNKIQSAVSLHQAFQNTGFAIVINHGIPTHCIQRLRGLALKYFEFDMEKKSSLADETSKEVSQKTFYKYNRVFVINYKC